MKLNVYVIKDTQLDRYNLPFFARNDDEAKIILVRSGIPKSIYEDTKLFKVGTFSDDLKNDQLSSCLSSHLPIEIQMLPYPNKEGVTL